MSVCLLLVAKSPVPGLAKTRMCPPLSAECAADISAAALLDTVDTVLSTPGLVPVVAFVGELDDACRSEELCRYLSGMLVIWQRGQDFASRLANAHRDVAALYPGTPVLQIGADTPQLRSDQLASAAELLRCGQEEALLGPAEDGGWWALGLRDPTAAQVLTDVPTSRTDTGLLTRDALRRSGLRVNDLDYMSDVDTYEDARLVAASIPGTRCASAVPSAATIDSPSGRRGSAGPRQTPTGSPRR
ncbi:MAG: DUF2064 domain-containing protein [Pseudonocardiaceae bacterium]|nr:DUF2064 domain-containing protein [Pseudonocardiaceae bacterium]